MRVLQIVTTIKLATWNEDKRLRNLQVHHSEQRLVVFGRLKGQVVVLVYTERRKGPHIISLREAEKHEARYYIAEARKFQGEGQGH